MNSDGKEVKLGWATFWLFIIAMNACDINLEITKQRHALDRIATVVEQQVTPVK